MPRALKHDPHLSLLVISSVKHTPSGEAITAQYAINLQTNWNFVTPKLALIFLTTCDPHPPISPDRLPTTLPINPHMLLF